MYSKMDRMFAKRANLHWFVGEGLEEGELWEARENMAYLMSQYKELEIDEAGRDDKDEAQEDKK